jgi:cytohesin
MVDLLIQLGADINPSGFGRWTPLHCAIRHHRKDVAKHFIEIGADINGIGTPLNVAIEEGEKEIAELLILKNANVNLKDEEGKTPLHYAADYCKITAPKSETRRKEMENELALAKSMIELLVQEGANINAKDVYGNTPLDIAKRYNHKAILDLLEKAKCK